jgi:hypothetical protein
VNDPLKALARFFTRHGRPGAPKQASVGGFLRGLGASAAGGVGGAALTGAEAASGWLPEGTSAPSTGALLGTNVALGAMVANPAMARRLFTRPGFEAIKGDPLGRFAQTQALRPARVVGTTMAAAGLPKWVGLGDRSYQALTRGVDAVDQHIGKARDAVGDPGKHLMPYARQLFDEKVAPLLSQVVGGPTGQEFGKTLGLGAAALVGGGLAGRMAGGALGHGLAPDAPHLDYQSRRNRERLRSFINFGMGAAGSTAAPFALAALMGRQAAKP